MQSWLSWFTTGILFALFFLAALLLIGLARLAPNVIRCVARSALAVAVLNLAIKMTVNACYASAD